MTELQRHLLALVGEIDRACADLKAPWAFYGGSAGWAMTKGAFVGQCCEVHIMMRAADALKVKDALMARKMPHRAFEDLHSNPKLAYNHLRYTDTGTTLIDRDDCVRYDLLGAAVIIHPLFAEKPDQRTLDIQRGVLYLNAGAEYDSYLLGEEERKKMESGRKLRKIFGDAVLSKRLYKLIKKDKGFGAGGKCYFEDEDGTMRSMKASYLFDTKRIPFEDTEVPVARETEKYLKMHFRKAWNPAKAEPLKTANRIAVICDAATPFDETLSYMADAGFDIRGLQQEAYEYYNWSHDTLLYWKTAVDFDYAHATYSRDRIDIYMALKGQMDELRAAREGQDYAKLEELLANYMKKTRKYLKKNLGFFINQELFDAAKSVWEHKGKTGYADEVYTLVPQVYKDEDIEEFLSAYK